MELLSKRIIQVEALPELDVQQTTNLAIQALGPNTAIRFQVCLDTVKKFYFSLVSPWSKVVIRFQVYLDRVKKFYFFIGFAQIKCHYTIKKLNLLSFPNTKENCPFLKIFINKALNYHSLKILFPFNHKPNFKIFSKCAKLMLKKAILRYHLIWFYLLLDI